MNKTINDIKNKIYEAEGLLELLQLRHDKLNDLKPMILSKVEDVRRALESLASEESYDEVPLAQPAEIQHKVADSIEDVVETAEEPVKNPSVAPAFCLNDRFRFRRTIFGGSDAEFNAAMDKVALFDCYEEAEEYFLDDMNLDSENEDVVDFLAIIKNYYER